MPPKNLLPEHVRKIHDALSLHPDLVVLANGTGNVYFKGYRRSDTFERDSISDKHFIRVHNSFFRGLGGPNSGCLIIHNNDKLGVDFASVIRKHFGPVCVSMASGRDHASFRDGVQVNEVVDAICAFGDDLGKS